MNEVAVREPTTSSPKRDRVLAALAAGKSTAEAAAEAGCSIPYAQVVAREQKASVSITVDPNEAAELKSALKDFPSSEGIQVVNVASPHIHRAGVEQLDADTPEENRKDPGLPSRRAVAKRIWPIVAERVCRRLRANDERFKNAAQDAYEAADCFLIKARGHDGDVVDAALTTWPTMWRDYAARGVMQNIQLATESANMALAAAKVFLAHA